MVAATWDNDGYLWIFPKAGAGDPVASKSISRFSMWLGTELTWTTIDLVPGKELSL